MHQWSALLVLALVASLGGSQTAKKKDKGQKYAFLVACSGYTAGEFRKLPGTVKEMQDFRQALIDSGWPAHNIVFLHDDQTPRRYQAEKRKILKELALLLNRLEKEDTLVVALNGHGLHFKGDKVGYFVPVDGELKDKTSLVPMDGKGGLFEKLKGCKAERKLLLVNACRNSPADAKDFAAKKVEADDEDKAEIPKGIAALYSCQQGEKSYEYPKKTNKGKPGRSLFYHHVIEAWRGEYSEGKPVTIEHLFKEVRGRASLDASEIFEKPQVPQTRRLYEGEWVVNDRVLAKSFTNSIGMKLVLIPAGKFLMGSPKPEKDRGGDELQHPVEITKAFYLGVYEVTQDEFRKVMSYNPSHFSSDGKGKPGATSLTFPLGKPGGGKDKVRGLATGKFPVENVSHDEALEFCKKLAALPKEKAGGRVYRLPTEAEWEYACRGGASSTNYRVFHFGNSLSSKQANFTGAYPYGGAAKANYPNRTCAVGSYKPNAFGLYDMHGNVWEWCSDWYGKDYYKKSPAKDPRGPSGGAYRVFRGGGWFSDRGGLCRSAARPWRSPKVRSFNLGFRVAVQAQ